MQALMSTYLAAFTSHSAEMNSISDVLADDTQMLTFRYLHFRRPHCASQQTVANVPETNVIFTYFSILLYSSGLD